MFASPSNAILELGGRYAAHHQMSLRTLGVYCANQGEFFLRLARGADVTAGRANRIAAWFSAQWPNDLTWPVGVARPAEPAAVGAARAAFKALVDAPNSAARRGAAVKALKIGSRLDGTGRIACPGALCAAIGVKPQVFEDVVRRYSNGRRRGRGTAPRAGSTTARMLAALREAGDVRFTPPSTQEAA